MNPEERTKFLNALFRLLKVQSLSVPIGLTEKGHLSVRFTKGEDNYEIILDAVPLDMKEDNIKELRHILNKYMFNETEISIPIIEDEIDEGNIDGIETEEDE